MVMLSKHSDKIYNTCSTVICTNKQRHFIILTRWSRLVHTLDFEILLRAGKIMSDLDLLSRPVILVFHNVTNEDEVYIKKIDPWEYFYLLNFLTFGRHINGSSKKQCKRVSKLA